jgi:integrase/recombinase XerD
LTGSSSRTSHPIRFGPSCAKLEEKRGCGIATRNQRLAAIHSLALFIGQHSPEQVQWCGEIRSIPFKRSPRPLVNYLEKAEMDSMLAAPDRSRAQGRRDDALLLFLYNSGARADEIAHVRIADLGLGQTPERDPSSVLIHGKGNKQRRCPLWVRTVNELVPLMSGRAPSEFLFLNRCGRPLITYRTDCTVLRVVWRVHEDDNPNITIV